MAGHSTVLLVDDSPSMRVWLRRVVESHGFVAVCAPDGGAALAAMASHPIDLVVTDVNMDGIDGIELVRRLRASRAKTDLPILLLTTESAPERLEEGRKAGANGWITKPVEAARFIAIVSQALERVRAANAAS